VIYLAAVPLILPFLLLLGFKQSGLRTSLTSAVVTLALAWFFTTNSADLMSIAAQSAGNALAIAFGVLTVIFSGLLLYRLQAAAGSLAVMVEIVRRGFRSKDTQTLALVIGISTFVEAISGFGVSVLAVTPLLLTLGYSPLKAGALALFGQISVPLGALGVGTTIGAHLAKLPPAEVGTLSMLVSLPLPTLFAFSTLAVANGLRSIARYWPLALLCGTVKGGADYGFAGWFGIELAGALASLLMLLALFAGEKIMASAKREDAVSLDKRASINAIAPYALLITTLLATRMIPSVRDFLTHLAVIDPFGAGFTYPLLYIPGFWLLLAALSVPLLNRSASSLTKNIQQTWRQFLPAALTITFFLILAQIMILSGMAAVVAQAVGSLGFVYVAVAPFLGALGGWLTGQNSGGNAMFMPLQIEVSHAIGLPAPWAAAMQNAASSYGTIGSPARIALVCATIGDRHLEGALLRTMIPYVLASPVVIAIIYAFAVL